MHVQIYPAIMMSKSNENTLLTIFQKCLAVSKKVNNQDP